MKEGGNEGVATLKELLYSDEDLNRPMTIDELKSILSSTIKRDDPTKVILFLGMLNTFTDENQMNIALGSGSSTGKTYIALETAAYFPEEAVKIIGGATARSFHHETGTWDEKRKAIVVDLEGKILILLDQPDYQLMNNLRTFLSHDQKEITYKITDKNDKHGLRTKTVILRGYPTVVFCTTRGNPDEQEQTRFIMLSPSIEEEKIAEAILLQAEKLSDRDAYVKKLEVDPRRNWLRKRIRVIQLAGIRDVVIKDAKAIYERFRKEHAHLVPRHQRDFPRLMTIIKAHAMLNTFSHEKLDDGRIVATQEDIDAGFKLYGEVSEPNELGLSPEQYNLFKKVIESLWNELHRGLTRQEVRDAYYRVHHRPLQEEKFRRDILPALESSGLIYQEPDPDNRNRILIHLPEKNQPKIPVIIQARFETAGA